jgi:anti-anti-sigma factor
MSVVKNVQDGICRMSIAGDIKIYDAVKTKDEMLKEFQTYREFRLDLSQIEEMDASGLQLLILLRKEIERFQIPFELVAASTPVFKLLDLYRLRDWFQSNK